MEIYYFSGTGNSLALTRELADWIDAEAMPMAYYIAKDSVQIKRDSVGFVFPVYFALNDCGIPNIVQEFLGRIDGLKDKYIFAVCTSENMHWKTIENTQKLIEQKGGKLSAGFIVNTSSVELGEGIKAKFSKEKKVDTVSNKLDLSDAVSKIVKVVSAKENYREQEGKLHKKVLYSVLAVLSKIAFTIRYGRLSGQKYKNFSECVKHADNSFEVYDNCIGCGTCMRVCPVNNITMDDKKPKWNNNCENCLACYQFCPQNAIGGKIVEYNRRYHHFEVRAGDMEAQKG